MFDSNPYFLLKFRLMVHPVKTKACIRINLHAEDIFARGKVPGCALMAYFIVSTPPAMAAGSATGICRGVMSNAVMSSSPPNSRNIDDGLLGIKMKIKI